MKGKLLRSMLFLLSLMSVAQLKAQHQNALDFDGVDDESIVGAASGLIANSNTISMSMWVYATNATPVFPDYDGFAGFRNNTDCDFYLVEFGTNRVEARYRNSAGVNFDIVDTLLPINTWVHYAFVYNGTELTLYRNATIVKTIIATGNITNTGVDFYMGNMDYLGNSFLLTGKLDEVALWNRALNPNDVSCIYSESINPSDIALKLYFDFNQGEADSDNTAILDLVDVSGHSNAVLNNFTQDGATSNFVAGINNYTLVSDVLCQGATFTYAGQNFNSPGTYLLRFPITNICDSVVSVELTALDTSITESGGLLTSNQSAGQYQWIDCLSGNAIAGETAQSFYPLSSGLYAVVVSGNGCSDTSACYNIISNGVANLLKSQIKINENPFSNKLTIDPGASKLTMITIQNALGQIVHSEKVNGNLIEINTGNWSSGIYFINCISEEAKVTLKAVKR